VCAFNPKTYEYGFAPSPVVYGDTIIVAAEWDNEESSLIALDRASGKQIWRTPRPKNISFSSPVVAHLAGRDQLLISGADLVVSYDPTSGKELWSVPCITAATCGTLVWEGDIVYGSGGYPKSETVAIRVSKSGGEVLWRNRQNCYEESMLATDGYLYALTGKGVVYCWNGTTGDEQWSQRLKGPVSSSPVLAGGHIYWTNEFGTTYVFQPTPQKFELVAENQLGEEGFASPAVSRGQFFLRTATRTGGKRQEWLYCLGK
jgi:outer membrane protein assembly factor BamB